MIVGHTRLLTRLARACARETLPPSLLLAGPAGVGKRRTALAIAEALNCLTPRASEIPGSARGAAAPLERDACGECAACRRIARGVHPDVVIVEPGDSGAIKIDAVRDLIDRAAYRPFEGRRRVVILDEADAMTVEAQSALLKTLEEPPSASVFIMVSSLADTLLPTVRSRCPPLRFAALAPAEVAEALTRDHGYAEAEARAAAADADGSIGRALAARSLEVTTARTIAQRLLEQVARVSDPARRLDAAKDVTPKKATPAQERAHLTVCLRVLASLLRDLGILASRGDTTMLANVDLEADLNRLATSFDGERTTRAFAAVDRALGALERNASPKVVADWLVLQL